MTIAHDFCEAIKLTDSKNITDEKKESPLAREQFICMSTKYFNALHTLAQVLAVGEDELPYLQGSVSGVKKQYEFKDHSLLVVIINSNGDAVAFKCYAEVW